MFTKETFNTLKETCLIIEVIYNNFEIIFSNNSYLEIITFVTNFNVMMYIFDSDLVWRMQFMIIKG